MKHFLLSLLLILSFSQSATAVPALSRPRNFAQGDGTTLTILRKGDEFFHYTTTADGHLLAFNSETQCYEYAQITNGTLTRSGLTAHNEAERTSAELSFLQQLSSDSIAQFKAQGQQTRQTKQARRAVRRAAANSATDNASTYGPSYVSPKMRITSIPTTGHHKALAILVDFPDKKFTDYVGDAQAFYSKMLNEENYTNDYGATGSAYDFYHTTSAGLYSPEFDVVGPVTVSQSYTYYGGEAGDGTAYVPNMIAEAIQLADAQVNFADYDTDGDGYIDFIYVFYAGYGQADSDYDTTIWPHSYNLTAAGVNVTVDGVTADLYACSQELCGYAYEHTDLVGKPTGIGTFVHEFGHVLGIPDLYNTADKEGTDTKTPGYYDTMDQGSYNNDQCTPPLFSAYERYVLGWMEPTLLTADTDATWTLPALADENVAFLVKTTKDANYFILENRQQKGWDEYLPNHGMLVWQIKENAETWYKNTVNNASATVNKGIYFVVARSNSSYYYDYYIPYPGQGNVTSKTIKDSSTKTVFGFDNLKESSDGIITFKISNTGYLPTTAIHDITFENSDETAYFDLQGRRVCNPAHGIFIVRTKDGCRKIVR